ncbi:hypothetical protein DPQ25_07185 [Hydrogeniiclostridium mannosilyticum]|uniref:Uncharacterized protein n=1 Tax=Hydrogeniiclostridium mannosilyticum TaxID=2764322 RepID=A0A328UCU0_9FIRM|nr:hypothetical protein DPQ25_07185 [Hydrogeniiclostridium mannosilyticum]
MLNYCLDLIEKSRWFVSAPSISRPSFPFSASEAGLFYAGPRYFTERSEKDNYLLLFTLAGMGESIRLEVILNCTQARLP